MNGCIMNHTHPSTDQAGGIKTDKFVGPWILFSPPQHAWTMYVT